MNKFEALGLNESIVKAVTELGFESPTPIQEKAIPALLNGTTDLVALAQTGTGKTATFGLPLVSLIDFSSKETQAVILCPTRELCMQITRDLQSYTKYTKGANIVAVYGGASIENQTRDIRKGAQIVVATPGRMNDMIDRKRVNLSSVRYAVLDEADEMLNMGFKEDLDTILNQTPSDKNTWLFSATMPNEVLRISKNYMTDPIEITVGSKNSGNENIEHIYYVVQGRDKYAALKRVCDSNADIFAIVFCRTRMETQEIADKLIKDGYNADALHGDLSQQQRDHVMKRYRSRSIQMLVATDVAARGIDVDNVTHVINYVLPDEIENYTHRSGRTARAGKKGISISIISNRDIGKIRAIERIIKQKFRQATVPTGIEACETQLLSLVKKVHDVQVDEEAIMPYMPKIMEELNDLSKEDIIKRFVSTDFNRFLDYYKNAHDLNASGSRDRGSSNNGITKLFVNLGELDNLDRNSMKAYISEMAGIDNNAIESIEVKSSFSFIEVKSEVAETITKVFKDAKYNNRNVRIESRGDEGRSRSGSDRGRPSRGYEGKRSYGGGNSYGVRSGGNRSDRSGGRERSSSSSRSGGNSGSDRKSYGERVDRGAYSRSGSETSGSDRKSNFVREKRPRKSF